jgi:hypothetical protein
MMSRSGIGVFLCSLGFLHHFSAFLRS